MPGSVLSGGQETAAGGFQPSRRLPCAKVLLGYGSALLILAGRYDETAAVYEQARDLGAAHVDLPHDHRMWAVIGIYGGAEDNTL